MKDPIKKFSNKKGSKESFTGYVSSSNERNESILKKGKFKQWAIKDGFS